MLRTKCDCLCSTVIEELLVLGKSSNFGAVIHLTKYDAIDEAHFLRSSNTRNSYQKILGSEITQCLPMLCIRYHGNLLMLQASFFHGAKAGSIHLLNASSVVIRVIPYSFFLVKSFSLIGSGPFVRTQHLYAFHSIFVYQQGSSP